MLEPTTLVAFFKLLKNQFNDKLYIIVLDDTPHQYFAFVKTLARSLVITRLFVRRLFFLGNM
jgi:hypothetical protein